MLISHHSECKKDGVLLPDGRRLIALHNYRDETGEEKTLIVGSLDDLMPIANQLGPNLMKLIDKNGVTADDSKKPITFLCNTSGFHYSNSLQVGTRDCLRVQSEGDGSPMTTYFWLEHLDRGIQGLLDDPTAAPASHTDQGSFACDSLTQSLRLTSQFSNSPIKTDLRISKDKINGTIQVGSCQVELKDQPKDFWHGEIKSADLDLDLAIGIGIASRGYIHIDPARIASKCLEGTSYDSKSMRVGGFTWYAD
jgi:hypothetical protein